MLVCVIASAIAMALMAESIMTKKPVRRGLKMHLECEVNVLRQATVREVMDAKLVSLRADQRLSELTGA